MTDRLLDSAKMAMRLTVMAAALWWITIPVVIAAVPEDLVIEARVTAINVSQEYVELDGLRYSLDRLIRGAKAGDSDSTESLEILRTALLGETVFVAVTGIATPTEPTRIVRARRTRW